MHDLIVSNKYRHKNVCVVLFTVRAAVYVRGGGGGGGDDDGTNHFVE